MIRVLLLFVLFFAPLAHAQDTPEPLKEEDILPYLEQVITFNRAIVDAEQLPDTTREVILKDALKQNARKILQKGFAFAEAQSDMFARTESVEGEDPKDAATTRRGRLLQAVANNEKSIAELNQKLALPNQSPQLRERLKGQLKLANAQQELLKTMLGIFVSEDSAHASLAEQIKFLRRTEMPVVPDSNGKETSVKTVAPAPVEEKKDIRDDDGMLGLSTAMFASSRKQSQIEELLTQNKLLRDKNRTLLSSIRAELRTSIEAGKTLAEQSGDDAKSMASYRTSLNELLSRYNALGATIIPIGEMNVLIESSERQLMEWSKLIHDDWSHILGRLLMRVIILAVAVSIPLVVSHIVHRAIGRYIKDPRRAKQLNIVRRIVLITVLAFVILANFISEFGSLATFAGFITAGLAVALQTVLVSLVAHFFFFGRYGIRAGDRVTVSGVTGDVIQVGVLRLYIRELYEHEGQWHPTGKMVAFPNSILFQPAAFYKHVEG